MNSWTEYKADFLAPERAKAIFDWITELPLHLESGYCAKPNLTTIELPHLSIQWGPRQAYSRCVPAEHRITSSGPIPYRLSKLHEQIQERFQARFNSIQVNLHPNENNSVNPYSDLMHGHIVMLSLGAERRFVLRYKHDHKAKTPKWKAGEIYFDEKLANGSLLTIFRQHQFDLTHEMPKAEHPCGPRVSMIWRYLAQPVTQNLNRDALIAGQSEYDEAQAKWRLERKEAK